MLISAWDAMAGSDNDNENNEDKGRTRRRWKNNYAQCTPARGRVVAGG
jgi:hypothetical protein